MPRAAETVTVTATNSGGSASVSFAVTVVAADTAAPVLAAGALDVAVSPATLSVTVGEGGTAFWMVDGAATRGAAEVEAGGGAASGDFEVGSGATTADVDLGALAPGAWTLHLTVRDAAGNRSNVISTDFALEAEATSAIAVERSAVVVNDTAFQSPASSYTGVPFTVGSKANRLLVAIVHGYSDTVASPPSDVVLSFGGSAMTRHLAPASAPSTRGWIGIHTLTAPPTGDGVLTAAWSGVSRACAITLIEVSGVDQTNPSVAAGSVDSAGNLVRSLAFSRADGDLILSGLALGKGSRGAEIASGATLLQSGQTGTGPTSDTSFGAAHASGGHGYAWTSDDWAALGWLELRKV